MMEPYYSKDGITIYNADCREVLPSLDKRWTAIVTDPPYGMDWDKTAIIVYTTPAGQLGMASYGETRTLCAEAGKCGDRLFDEATKFYSEDTP